MSAADDFLVRSLYQSCVEWSSRDQNRLLVFEEPRRELALSSLTYGAAIVDLGFLAVWYGALTVRAGWDGLPVAPLVASAHHASLLQARVALSSFLNDTRRRRRFRLWRSGTALDAARALAYGWLDDARAISRLLETHDESGLLSRGASPMPGFVRALIRLLDGRSTAEIDIAEVPDSYRHLLDHWDGDATVVGNRLARACATRAEWASEASNVTPEGPLSDIAYAAWPVELLALLRVRAAHSLAPVVAEHSLMTAPLGALADYSAVEASEPVLLGFAQRYPELLQEP